MLNVVVLSQFWPQNCAPKGLRGPEGSRFERKGHNFGQNPTAHFRLKRIVFGQNCSSHTCARIKRLVITPLRGVIPPPSGVVREPGSRRLTVRLRKEKEAALRYAVFGWGC